MPALNLNGIEVNFPYEPYPCQVDYMKCVLDSITQVSETTITGVLNQP